MKYFIVEGMIKNADLSDDNIMKEHMAYTQKAMDNGSILISGLKEDMSGGIFVMKAKSLSDLEAYLNSEPFKVNGIQDYKVTEFAAHYFNEEIDKFFERN